MRASYRLPAYLVAQLPTQQNWPCPDGQVERISGIHAMLGMSQKKLVSAATGETVALGKLDHAHGPVKRSAPARRQRNNWP